MTIFYLNVGRSGSMAVAKYFKIEHEPDVHHPDIERLKKRIELSKLRQVGYGETSHFWKRYLEELTTTMPKAKFVHLIRDGRKVVRSFYCATRFFRNFKDDYSYRNEKLPIKGWSKMNRFEKCCWYWRYWNEEIEKYTDVQIKIEDLKIPVENNSFKKQKYWNDYMETTFKRICGDLNKKYGYLDNWK